jgi:acryloyl-coenzyme A reductase
MKAVLLTTHKQQLELRDEQTPNLGTDEILIRVEAAGVCFKDILIVDGFQPRVKLPIVLGHECAGRIQAIGSGVTGFAVGDRVCSLPYIPCGACKFCLSDRENICRSRKWLGEDQNGAYAQSVRSHMNAVIRIPEEVGINAAAAATCVLGTVIHGLKRLANLKPRQTVLVTGAAGAVGTSALLVAKALGAQTIGTDIPEKLAEVGKSGADEAIAFSDNLSDEIKKLTGGDGVDVVLEAVGPPTFEQGMRSVRWGGKIVVIGNVAPSQAIPFLLGSIILREISILGCMNATKADIFDALALMASRKLAPDIRIKFPLEEAQHAHDLIRQKKSVGKIILQPNE